MTGVTLSSRTANNHVEPIYGPNVPCELNNETGTTPSSIVDHNGQQIFAVNAVCRGINNRAVSVITGRSAPASLYSIDRRKNKKGPGDSMLNFDNAAQDFMFALGPTDRTIKDDSKGANIRRHSVYGTFTLGLNAATVQSSNDVDQVALAAVGNWQIKNAKLVGGPNNDMDWALIIHAVLLCGSFVILFPIGVVFLRVLDKVKWHAYMQGVGLLLIIVGVGLGLGASGQYVHVSLSLLLPDYPLLYPTYFGPWE